MESMQLPEELWLRVHACSPQGRLACKFLRDLTPEALRKGPSPTMRRIIDLLARLCVRLTAVPGVVAGKSRIRIGGNNLNLAEAARESIEPLVRKCVVDPGVPFRPYVHVTVSIACRGVYHCHDVYEIIKRFKAAMLNAMGRYDPEHPCKISDISEAGYKTMRGRFEVCKGPSISLWTQMSVSNRRICDIYCTFVRR